MLSLQTVVFPFKDTQFVLKFVELFVTGGLICDQELQPFVLLLQCVKERQILFYCRTQVVQVGL